MSILERSTVHRRHREERKRRSNPFSLHAAKWIASRSLSSGAHSRDPLDRNDALNFPRSIVANSDEFNDVRSNGFPLAGLVQRVAPR
jgi:hypothetical protein